MFYLFYLRIKLCCTKKFRFKRLLKHLLKKSTHCNRNLINLVSNQKKTKK